MGGQRYWILQQINKILFLQDNNIEIYLTHNEGKSDVAERFIRTKDKLYKHLP